MKQRLLTLFAPVLMLATLACGSGSSSGNNGGGDVRSGNWLWTGVSQVALANGQGYRMTKVRGALTPAPNGAATLNGQLVGATNCFPAIASVVLAGSSSNTAITLTSPDFGSMDPLHVGSVLAISATMDPVSHLYGNYTVSPSTFVGPANPCPDGDNGSIDAVLVPPLSGDWSGTFVTTSQSAPPQASIATNLTLTQAAAGTSPAIAGAFPLSGTVTLQNLPCFTSGNIDPNQSYVLGELVQIVASSGTAGVKLRGVVQDPPTATSLGIQTVFGSGDCNTVFANSTATFNKM